MIRENYVYQIGKIQQVGHLWCSWDCTESAAAVGKHILPRQGLISVWPWSHTPGINCTGECTGTEMCLQGRVNIASHSPRLKCVSWRGSSWWWVHTFEGYCASEVEFGSCWARSAHWKYPRQQGCQAVCLEWCCLKRLNEYTCVLAVYF